MDYDDLKQTGRDLILTDVRNFNFPDTLDCGQAFRWSDNRVLDNRTVENRAAECRPHCFSGVAFGRLLELELDGDRLVMKNVSADEFDSVWKGYFEFDRDYSKLREELVFYGGEPMRKAVEFSPGLRLLRQDPWEMLISFILSQNSNIPRIRRMIASLCEAFGERLPCGASAFPKPDALAGLSVEELAPVKTGYRAPYIIDAAKQVAGGMFDINKLRHASTEEIGSALLKIHGVGPKVADCVLLFGFNRIECYPMDVWMKRAMADAYPDGFPDEMKPIAGIAQQFLFHCYRTR